MSRNAPSPTAYRVADLSQNTKTEFALRPGAGDLERIAAELDLLGLRKLSFSGHLRGEGRTDWRLDATLGATVIQPCGITLQPVTTRIDVPVTRLFQADYTEIDAPEAEMPDDDTTEPLTAWIDPAEIMVEALVLALPLYPRSPGAELGEAVYTAPGAAPMRDEDARPFAGLAGLKDQLRDPDGNDGDTGDA
ncbi:YceD family protein [Sulfitobacter sabulilitoris]|uniref:DUF177 domain-containing protein n=1 Tax=Sulfitobacter sabulilitoris TaxID=2562655 RepID=A0A5S3PK74_9RHOB|nr:DUF177 domain-containing protein [Sulfitobacter sabulilitoris]TMM54828.1 DUF177 domain-containing protein [Sulfitobacter sabulilitoris]